MNQSSNLQSWEEVIVDFFENKVDCKLHKKKNDINKNEKELEGINESEKNSIKINKLTKKLKLQKEELKNLRKTAPSSEIREWIESNSKKNINAGSRIIKATHVLKFTNGSAPPAGLLNIEKSNDLFMTTSSMKKSLTIDMAHNNGNLITISRFLALQLSNKLIIDHILDAEFSFLRPFTASDQQLEAWKKGLSNLVEQREITVADKAKQVYFPTEMITSNIKDTKYHLIVPLFASSLGNEFNTNKYSKQSKVIASNKKNSKYHSHLSISYPNIAIQKFGGAHPKNISMLNADRNGESHLFSAQPPHWKSNFKPPMHKKSFFDYYRQSANTKENIDYLIKFLMRFNNPTTKLKLKLSIKNPQRKKHLDRWVNSIIDDLLYNISHIHSLPAGWSKESKLLEHYQFLLDPNRQEESFQNKLDSSDWQKEICNDFSGWLNKELWKINKSFTSQDEHRDIWKKLFKTPLREYFEIIKMKQKHQHHEVN